MAFGGVLGRTGPGQFVLGAPAESGASASFALALLAETAAAGNATLYAGFALDGTVAAGWSGEVIAYAAFAAPVAVSQSWAASHEAVAAFAQALGAGVAFDAKRETLGAFAVVETASGTFVVPARFVASGGAFVMVVDQLVSEG